MAGQRSQPCSGRPLPPDQGTGFCSRLSPQRSGALQPPLPLTPGANAATPHTCSPKHIAQLPALPGARSSGTPPAAPSPPLTGCPSRRAPASRPAASRTGLPGAARAPPAPLSARAPLSPSRAGRYLSGGASRACGRRGLSWPHTPPAAKPRPLSSAARVCPAAAASEGAPCEERAQLRDPGP